MRKGLRGEVSLVFLYPEKPLKYTGWEHKCSLCLIVSACSKLFEFVLKLSYLGFCFLCLSSYFIYFIVSDAEGEVLLCVEVSVLLELSIVQTCYRALFQVWYFS